MKKIFDEVSLKCSEITTKHYSTSFSLGIKLLGKKIHNPIYSIYGFVRLADEIVDSFHDFEKMELLNEFKEDTIAAIEKRISLNPILNSFQEVVNKYNIEWEHIQNFLSSMECDLNQKKHDEDSYKEYIKGSAEAVGLMCLRVFCNNNNKLYNDLEKYAIYLGSVFQKVNFIRDISADYSELKRVYFPQLNINEFNEANFKLAFNLEYRAPLIGPFKGAIFIDAGNIWNAFDNISDPKMKFNGFEDLSEIAIGIGFGIRYDFNFFVFRLDTGFKAYNPVLPLEKRWWNQTSFKNAVYNIGINYPF